MTKPFGGNPRLYRKASVLLSLYITVSTYAGFAGVKYLVHGETWVFGWKPVAVAVVFAVFFSRFAFRWIMRLDAQYGSGRSWRLLPAEVKLPELRQH